MGRVVILDILGAFNLSRYHSDISIRLELSIFMTTFSHTAGELANLASTVLNQANKLGATASAVQISEGNGLSVNVRNGTVETVEQMRDKGMSVTVYHGQARGNASTSDFSLSAIQSAVSAAFDIARMTAPDPAAGLPDLDDLATPEQRARDLELCRPWKIDVAGSTDLALRIERAALDYDKAIANSDGASVSSYQGQFVLANSAGFSDGYAYSRHSTGVAPIAKQGEQMQRDGWYSSNIDSSRLADPEALGRYAAQRALSRLGARRLNTMKCPVVFEAPVAAGLLGSLVQATSGGALYRKSSFLLDSLGRSIFPKAIQVFEDPWISGAQGSGSFDDEGVDTRQRQLIEDGVLTGYFLSSYSARKLGMKTTGNAGGSHNLRLYSKKPTSGGLPGLLKLMDRGLLVTELMGQGVNYVNGDYSRGASGFWVERGEIQYPVEEITIAGNLKTMFKQLIAIADDEVNRGSKTVGSVLIKQMSIAGQ
jgi:PmbA protein